MKFTIPLTRNSDAGNLQPINLYAQLRLKADGTTVISQGAQLGTKIGWHEFEVLNLNLLQPLALYVCTTQDGIYEEEITWGGTAGKRLKDSLEIQIMCTYVASTFEGIATRNDTTATIAITKNNTGDYTAIASLPIFDVGAIYTDCYFSLKTLANPRCFNYGYEIADAVTINFNQQNTLSAGALTNGSPINAFSMLIKISPILS